jgi:hypothetical protein
VTARCTMRMLLFYVTNVCIVNVNVAGVYTVTHMMIRPLQVTSEATGRLPGLRRSQSRYWSSYHRRWLVPLELCAAMGLPVYRELALAGRVGLFYFRCPNHAIRKLLGNMMHIHSVALAMLMVLTAAGPRCTHTSYLVIDASRLSHFIH